jgi:hypothetical protein
MVRRIKAIYTASDDPDFGVEVEQAVLIAPDMIIEAEECSEWTFLIIPPVPADQNTVEVDRATCGYFSLGISHSLEEEEREPNYDIISEVSLLDFIRSYAKK